MKIKFLFLSLFIVSYSFSQTVNDYKAVIIPMRYDFLKDENQYRLQTITKINFQKAGIPAFYANEVLPTDLKDRCSLLYVDVKKENAFLITKLSVIFKDCYGVVIYQSASGKSKEKEWGLAYSDALNDAFKSVVALNYKYNENKNVETKSAIVSEKTSPTVVPVVDVPVVAVNKEEIETKIIDNKSSNLLYAQPTSYGYQLIDSEPKVVMKVYKTSNPASFMAIKGSIQGVFVSKDNQWFFEYYQNDQLISEKVEVKF